MKQRTPRVVVVTRATDYELLLARHSTRSAAAFFLETRGRHIDEVEQRHLRQATALDQVLRRIPLQWRRSRVQREDLDRFVFEPHDTIVAVGQDGLVANVSKYLHGQPVLGVNPDPESYDGVLVPLPAEAVGDLLEPAANRRVKTQSRTMVEARLDDGQRLVALNELFIGHMTHQSARYQIHWGKMTEHQSSSGVIVATGTGATGWARSIAGQRADALSLPAPTDSRLCFFVREPFPSVSTGTSVSAGSIEADHELEVVSELNEGGTVFGDGVEGDSLQFDWGMKLRVRVSDRRLELVTA